MPKYTSISAATAFMAQVKDIGDWKPINLKYAAIVHFKKMLDSPQVCNYLLKVNVIIISNKSSIINEEINADSRLQ